MNTEQLVFVAGLHRSGTSLLHNILRSHPDVSGFENTHAIEDEGQFLQSVYNRASVYGGPGRFGFNPDSFMDETHPLATPESAEKLIREWGQYWDTAKPFWLEKSPPNLVRTRFLQALFPNAKFIVILRHPVAVAYATRKWSKTSITSLVEHSLVCYERFQQDMTHLSNVYVLRYEDFIESPEYIFNNILEWAKLDTYQPGINIKSDINAGYFQEFESDCSNIFKKIWWDFRLKHQNFESRANVFGYSLQNLNSLPHSELLSIAPKG